MHRPPPTHRPGLTGWLAPIFPYNFAFHQRPHASAIASICRVSVASERMVSPFAQLAGLRATAFAARD